MTAYQSQVALLLLLSVHLSVAVYWDVRERRVPNRTVLSGLFTALVFHGLVSGLPGLGAAMVGGITGLLVLLPLNMLRIMGAGDVKLMAMAGTFGAGFQTTLWMVLYTLLAGGFLVVVFAARGQVRQKLVGNLLAMLRPGPVEPDDQDPGNNKNSKLQSAARLPYAVAIACGSLGYLLFARL